MQSLMQAYVESVITDWVDQLDSDAAPGDSETEELWTEFLRGLGGPA